MAAAEVDELSKAPRILTERHDGSSQPARGAYLALGLLLAMNMFNYIDRQVLAAVEPEIRHDIFGSDNENDPAVRRQSGFLASAFLISYMLTAPIFGAGAALSRWKLIAIGVFVWSLATGASGWAGTFIVLLITRCFVGVGEGAYGPLAPSILSDSFPVSQRGKILFVLLRRHARRRGLGLHARRGHGEMGSASKAGAGPFTLLSFLE